MSDIPSQAFKDGKFSEAQKIYNILIQISFTSPPESFMERVQYNCKGRIACDIMLKWVSIADVITAQTASTRDNNLRH